MTNSVEDISGRRTWGVGTGPQEHGAPQSSTGTPSQPLTQPFAYPSGDPLTTVARALDTISRLLDRDASTPASAGGGGTTKIAILMALIASGLVWGAHEVVGGRAQAVRLEEVEKRVAAIEEEQTWIRWSLTSIAQAV